MQKVKTKHSEKKPKLKHSDILYIAFLLIWTALAMIISQYAVAYPMAWILGPKAATPFWTLIFYLLNYALALFLIIWVPPRLVRLCEKSKTLKKSQHTELEALEDGLETTRDDLGVKNPPSFIDIGLAPIAYIIYIVVASIATNIMSLFSWFNADEAQDVGFGYFITTQDRIFAMLAIVFIAPIAEELIMRGWLYGKMRKKLGIFAAICLVSLLFGLLHGQLNVGITTFILSLALCGLREITGSIWSGILLHILTNGIAFYLLYVMI